MGLKFHDMSWLMSGAVKPKMLLDMLAVQPLAPKYDFAVTAPGLVSVRMKSMRGNEGYSIREIARITDVPEKTVSTRLARGRKILKKLITEVEQI